MEIDEDSVSAVVGLKFVTVARVENSVCEARRKNLTIVGIDGGPVRAVGGESMTSMGK